MTARLARGLGTTSIDLELEIPDVWREAKDVKRSELRD